MVDRDSAKKVAAALAGNLQGVSRDDRNFEGLPDSFWGYYARGHDSSGVFGVVVMYSESDGDVDAVIRMYEEWLAKRRSSSAPPSSPSLGVHE